MALFDFDITPPLLCVGPSGAMYNRVTYMKQNALIPVFQTGQRHTWLQQRVPRSSTGQDRACYGPSFRSSLSRRMPIIGCAKEHKRFWNLGFGSQGSLSQDQVAEGCR